MDAFVETALKTFCASHPIFEKGGIYVRFECEPVDTASDGLNSETFFGRIVYRDAQNPHEERVSPSLVLKTFPKIIFAADQMLTNFLNEIHFNARVRPAFEKLASMRRLLPHFYGTQTHIDTRHENIILIFENLRVQGYRTAARYSFLDVDHLTLMLRKIGQFHAYSYKAKAEDPRAFRSLGRWFYDTYSGVVDQFPNFIYRSAQNGLRHLRKDAKYADRMATAENLARNNVQFLDDLHNRQATEPLSVLCHGDYVRGNVMFRYDENGKPCDLKLIDMAMCRITSPALDLSTVLYMNADQRTRDHHWDTLIDAYYRGLHEPFGGHGVPAKDRILEEFRTKAFYAYLTASYFLPTTIPQDKGSDETFANFFKQKVRENGSADIPEYMWDDIYDRMNVEECNDALANILRDMVDRSFI